MNIPVFIMTIILLLQYWHITKDHLLRNDDVCIQAPPENENSNLAKLEKCDGNVKEQVTTNQICITLGVVLSSK